MIHLLPMAAIALLSQGQPTEPAQSPRNVFGQVMAAEATRGAKSAALPVTPIPPPPPTVVHLAFITPVTHEAVMHHVKLTKAIGVWYLPKDCWLNFRSASGAQSAAKILRNPAFIRMHNIQLVETFATINHRQNLKHTESINQWD